MTVNLGGWIWKNTENMQMRCEAGHNEHEVLTNLSIRRCQTRDPLDMIMSL